MKEKIKSLYLLNKKYIKWSFIFTTIVIVLFILVSFIYQNDKLKKDQKGHLYREINQKNQNIEIPVFDDSKLNKEIKKYEKQIRKDNQIKKVTYELIETNELKQVIWNKKRKDGSLQKDIWLYHKTKKEPLTLKEIFLHWNQEEKDFILTFLNLEWQRTIRTLTPPIPTDLNIEKELNDCIKQNSYYFHNEQNDHYLYFDFQKEEKNYQLKIPFYLLKDRVNWKLLGIKREDEIWLKEYAMNRQVVAFTFDDGPNPNTTPTLITEFKKRGMNATFFMLGRNVAKYPEVVKMVEINGFEVGSHTYNHRNLKRSSKEEQSYEIIKTNEEIKNASGKEATSIRPPYGNYNDDTISMIEVPIVLWNTDTLDWKYRDANLTYQNSIEKVTDGSIVLFHDIYYSSIDAAVKMASELYQRGYVLLSVHEMAQVKNKTLEAKNRYYSIK